MTHQRTQHQAPMHDGDVVQTLVTVPVDVEDDQILTWALARGYQLLRRMVQERRPDLDVERESVNVERQPMRPNPRCYVVHAITSEATCVVCKEPLGGHGYRLDGAMLRRLRNPQGANHLDRAHGPCVTLDRQRN